MRSTTALALVGAVSGCSSFDFGNWGAGPAPGPTPAAQAETQYAILPPDPLVGSWGLASYRDEHERARAEKTARAQCKNPQFIAKGPTDGVIMQIADDPGLHELALKKGADGKTYLGFNAPPGDPADREIVELTPKRMVMRFVDPAADARYGAVVYVRC